MAVIGLIGCTKEKDSSESVSNSSNEESNQTIDNHFAQLEKEFDAKLGVYAIDTGSGKIIDYQADERFAFTSTVKALAVGAVLQQNTMEELNETVTYTKDDLVTYSPITEKHVDSGMTLLELSEAAIRYSDNTAGNLLFNELGGPDGLEKAMRDIGDTVLHSNRTEPNLNEAQPGDIRDTSTPKALVTSLQAFALDDHLLSKPKQDMLLEWLQTNTTGDTLIRAGVPEEWTVGDKSGAGGYGTRNDIAIVWPPDQEPIVIAILSSRDTEDASYNDDLIKQATEITVDALK
ncbi:class A beta-lactamase [Oceanobacillus sp. AG]|uniref:class A beta-lactamase n=1 Tax=Oceanobacillus sp. AG TaxID=2681969 RepID=UPI0012EB8884|nr:class A beta-lactamase [Oceanobacillus sp. AG]